MPLTSGARLGPYEIVAPLGVGGMGEVYRARDTRLDRSVAIKSLSQAFAGDAERLARFDREAKLLASLNHANIAAIYDLENVGGTPYLVLEFVDGETLTQRLARGPMPLRETLEVAGQIAAAIEAAHERGIVHRDLKPGNVMLTASRVVKVLDFGLARGGAKEADSSADLSASPTVALSATAAGLILGTASYMSPEQARGRTVDRRTDVWAFGCVVFECLSGRQVFAGETVSDVIARILEREPDWSALPASVPPRVRDVVRRCLTKDVEERPRDIGDLRRELSAIAMEMSLPGGVVSPSVASVPSLAVLYFQNLASDAESEYFCAGITEDILTDLSKIKGLRVASRNAVSRYRGAPVDIPRVASELGVGAVLEGSVRRAGDRVRITTQLINAADGFQLWAERYDRTLQDVFAVQEEIASSIAAALRVALTPAESEKLVHNRPNDARAYDLYLKGRERYGSYTAESLRQALDLFQQAIAIDPDYALAWAGAADCYGQMQQWGSGENREELTRLGLEAARQAIRLNPHLAEAHKAEALVLGFAGDLEGARAANRRAIEVNPRFVPALINQAVDEVRRADLAAAERLIRRSLEIDPQEAFATTWIGFLTQQTGRSEECLETTNRLRGLSSDTFYITAAYYFRAWVALARGDLATAEQVVRDGIADGARPNDMRCIEAMIAVRAGRADESRRMVRELEQVSGLAAGSLMMVAGAANRLGDFDRAAGFMGRQLAASLSHTLVRLDPELHPLLDREPFAPRRRDAVLVWPLEAPMMDAARHALFREVHIESGIPRGSDVLQKS
jgi:serine/threonine protein kinase/tetratricopeptide (TPR) repeat protein